MIFKKFKYLFIVAFLKIIYLRFLNTLVFEKKLIYGLIKKKRNKPLVNALLKQIDLELYKRLIL